MTNAKLLTKENIKDVYTLSPVQEGILFHSLLEEDSTYFQQAAFHLRGELNVNRVQETLQELVNRHEVLRTTFKYEGLDVPLQIALKEWSADFIYRDLRHLTNAGEQQEFLNEFRKADREKLFDLRKDALIRLAVLQLADDEYELLWSHHHIIMDGWCLNILLSEFFEIYNSKQEQRPSRLPEAKPYSLYIKWLESRDKEKAQEYWQTYLKGYSEAARFSTQKPAAGREYLREKFLHIIGVDRLSALQSLAASNRVTVPHLLRAIWGLIVARYAGMRDVVFGEVITGRPPEIDKVETMIGLFVDTIPVRVKLNENDRFTDLLALVRHDSLAREEYSYFPLNEIQSLSEIEGSLFDHLVSIHSHPGAPVQSNNGKGDNLSIVDSFEQTNYDLVLDVHLGKTLVLSFTYNGHVHERSFIERLARVFDTVMDQVSAQPSIAVNNIGLLPKEDRALLDQFNATDREFSAERTVAEIIEEIAAATPERTAITFRDQTVSYGELNDRANRLAHFLNSQVSLAQDQRVALLMHRSDLMVACILAVWKLGAAYVPIDVNYPADRIRTLVTDAQARLVLTDSATAATSLPPETAGLIRLDQHAAELAAPPAGNLRLSFAPASLAYVIYTSGSTGKPKGVMIEHLGMLNHLFAKIAEFELDADSVVAQNASHCFDISIWQWFAPLLVGGRTVIYDNETVLNPEAQLQRLAADGVTIFETVPSYLEVMLSVVEEKQLAQQLATLRYMIVNGEVFKPALVRKWFALVPTVKLVNAYGATEVSDDSNHYIMSEAPPYEIIPLGATLPNLRIYIADEHMNLCPIGVKGEILIAGTGVGRGYLNDEERTRRAFTEDPFRPERDVRLYHTGDLGRYLDDGRLEFAGRKDYQVKVRGYRIELEEIEAVVMQHALVRAAMVIDKQDPAGDSYLSCYLAADEGFDVEELRSFVSQKLPHYMVPTYFKVLPSLPLNENGKHDRKALMQLPDAVEHGDHRTTYLAPRDEVEEQLARVWQEVLRLEKIGIKDDFFALGGDSFKAIRVVSKFGRGFLMPDLVNNPTIERLAEIVRRHGDGSRSLLYELSPKGGNKKVAVVAVPHSAGDPLVYQHTSEALQQLSDEYQFFAVAQPRPEPDQGETYQHLLQQLTEELMREIREIRIPVILYGQSNGSGLTLELARAMEREQLDLRAVCMGGALARLYIAPSTLGVDTRSDEAILRFVNGLGSTVPEDPADLAMFVRNFKYDAIIAAIAYYNALRDMQNGSYVKLEAPVFCVTGNRDPITPNYQTKYKDWFKFARRVGLVEINNVGHYLLRDTPEDVARLLHRIGAEDFEGVTDDEGRPTGVFTRLRAVFARR